MNGGGKLEPSKGEDVSESKSKVKKVVPLSIVIYGKGGTHRSFLAMQLLHGITKSLRSLPIGNKETEISLAEPIYYSGNKKEENLSDMLLDAVISKCVQRIIRNNIEKESKWLGNQFSSFIFELEKATNLSPLNSDTVDKYIGEEAVVYNERTNALHFTVAYRPDGEKISSNNNDNLIAKRQYNDINEYAKLLKNKKDIPDDLAEEFFELSICGNDSRINFKKKLNDISKSDKFIPCLVIDKNNDKTKADKNNIGVVNEYVKSKCLTIIYLSNEMEDLKSIKSDLIIELRIHEDEEIRYEINQLCISKSSLQTAALGWHQYKKRDNSIEVYPSAHLLLQRRRHMPKALLRTNTDILSDTFQQYVDANLYDTNIATVYEKYELTKNRIATGRLKGIFKTLKNDLHTSGILKNILVDRDSSGEEKEEADDERRGQTTVVIGSPNSYKRFLSLAKTFSASFAKRHTLYVLLDQEYNNLRKSMVCPTWEFRHSTSGKAPKNFLEHNSNGEPGLPPCHKCYSYIHFWNLRMGNITPDEFYFFFIQQLEAIKGIGQVIIDDIRKIEFSFPLLKRDILFLTTLISICKDYDVNLLILCDKSSAFVHELRSLADNVICTEVVCPEHKKEKETRIYLEKYAGYNAPSHIFACRIKKMEDLFYCESLNGKLSYHLNENRVENMNVFNMDEYWVDDNTKYIAKAQKKK